MEVESIKIERRLEQFKAAAKDAGVKLTHQRLEIFREIASSLEHPDAKTVFRTIQARIPTVSLDTVYRTLWMLNDLGLITTLDPRREGVRFDANLEPHHHYICVRCGLARDFESAELNTLRVSDAVKGFGSVVATHVEVRGICDRCAREQTEESVPKNPRQPRGRERRRT
jgi:Fur family peroxide stress response transcriptional regulator